MKAKIFDRLSVVTGIGLTPRTGIELDYDCVTLIVMVEVEGRQMGRKERLLGEMGTMSIPLTSLNKIGPPADKE